MMEQASAIWHICPTTRKPEELPPTVLPRPQEFRVGPKEHEGPRKSKEEDVIGSLLSVSWPMVACLGSQDVTHTRTYTVSAKDPMGLPHNLREQKVPKGPIFRIILFDKMSTLGVEVVAHFCPEPDRRLTVLSTVASSRVPSETHGRADSPRQVREVASQLSPRKSTWTGQTIRWLSRTPSRLGPQGGMTWPKELMSIPGATSKVARNGLFESRWPRFQK